MLGRQTSKALSSWLGRASRLSLRRPFSRNTGMASTTSTPPSSSAFSSSFSSSSTSETEFSAPEYTPEMNEARASAASTLSELAQAARSKAGPFTCWVTGKEYSRAEAVAGAREARRALEESHSHCPSPSEQETYNAAKRRDLPAAGSGSGSGLSSSSSSSSSYESGNENEQGSGGGGGGERFLLPATEAAELKIFFDEYGFLHLPNFASRSETQGMLDAMLDLVEDWVPEKELAKFSTGVRQTSDQYFLESADKVGFFAEVGAIDKETGKIREGISKLDALNKVGHGLHAADRMHGSVFHRYSAGPRVSALTRLLGWQAPVLPQSMYIFKNPGVGGEVASHQDSSFLFTEPRHSCLGLWLALHDARVDNGCLWVRPRSHLEPLRRVFRRQPSMQEPGTLDMVFEVLDEKGMSDTAPWEGAFPPDATDAPFRGLFESGFIPVEVKAGDLVCFPGTLDHLSLPNYSTLPRHTFQLHMVEGPAAGVHWSKGNWLQYPDGKEFVRVH